MLMVDDGGGGITRFIRFSLVGSPWRTGSTCVDGS